MAKDNTIWIVLGGGVLAYVLYEHFNQAPPAASQNNASTATPAPAVNVTAPDTPVLVLPAVNTQSTIPLATPPVVVTPIVKAPVNIPPQANPPVYVPPLNTNGYMNNSDIFVNTNDSLQYEEQNQDYPGVPGKKFDAPGNPGYSNNIMSGIVG